MNRKLIQISAVVGIVVLFFVAGIYAKSAPDTIKLEDPAYKEHKKGVVEFSHGKHQKDYAEAYPDLYTRGCGECHHNDKNEPTTAGILKWSKRPLDHFPLPHGYMGDLLRFNRVEVDLWAHEEAERRRVQHEKRRLRIV